MAHERSTTRAGEVAAVAPFWSRGWFWLLLALVSAVPFAVAPLPMMPDLFSHIGRYHVMNHGASPLLARYYAYRWRLIGNLGVDLLMVPLGHLWSTETAALVAVAAIPPLTVAGIYAVARAVWGRVEAPALFALPFVWTYSFLFGFVNYHLAVALALLAFALWVRAARWPVAVRVAVFVPVAVAVAVAHIAGWAVLVLLAGCRELVAARRSVGWSAAVVTAVRRCLPLAAPLLLMIGWHGGHSAGAGEGMAHGGFHLKLKWLYVVLQAEDRWLDLASLVIVAATGLTLAVARGVRRSHGTLLGAALLGAAFLVVPVFLFGSYFADERLLPVAAIVFFLAVAVAPGRAATSLAVAGVALFTVRVAATTIGWQRRGTAAVADLAALDHVPPGSRIAVLAVPSTCLGRVLTGRDHLASLAIPRRDAFVDTEWDAPGQQLMRPIYNLGRGFNDASAVITPGGRCAGGLTVAASLAALPRDRFDFVWVFDGRAPPLAWLKPVYTSPDARLYRIAAPVLVAAVR